MKQDKEKWRNKIRLTSFILIIIGLSTWIFFLLQQKSNLKKSRDKFKEKYHFSSSFNEVLEYKLDIARDSIRLLHQKKSAAIPSPTKKSQ